MWQLGMLGLVVAGFLVGCTKAGTQAKAPARPVVQRSQHAPEAWEREVQARVEQARQREAATHWQQELEAVRLLVVTARNSQPMIVVPIFTNQSTGGGGVAPSPLFAPTGVTLMAISAPGILVQWNDTNSTETGYEVQRSTNGSTGWGTVTTTAANDTDYIDEGLTPSQPYYYRVRAVDSVNGTTSPWSDVAGPESV